MSGSPTALNGPLAEAEEEEITLFQNRTQIHECSENGSLFWKKIFQEEESWGIRDRGGVNTLWNMVVVLPKNDTMAQAENRRHYHRPPGG